MVAAELLQYVGGDSAVNTGPKHGIHLNKVASEEEEELGMCVDPRTLGLAMQHQQCRAEVGLIRPLSVYSMGNESSDEMKLSSTRKKTYI